MSNLLARLRRLAQRMVRPASPQLAQWLPEHLPAAPPVTVTGFVSASTGMGEAVRGAITALQWVQHPLHYIDLETAPALAATELPPNAPRSRRATNLLYVNAPNVARAYARTRRGRFDRSTNIGFWYWEMPSLPRRYFGAFSIFREVWVASRYTQSALAATSPIPIVHIPPHVSPAEPGRLSRAQLGLPDDRFVFLSVCDAASILERKNPLAVIRAFAAAFGAATARGPQLVLKITNTELAASRPDLYALPATYMNEVHAALHAVGGILIDQRTDRATASALMAACDCYVSLHRCEGFGLTMAEAMYFSKPCIATAYSGNLDFMHPANSYPVGYRLITLDRNWGPYESGDVWAEPDIAQAAALMRQVFDEPAEASRRGERAAQDIRSSYGAEAAGRAMQRRLQLATLR